MDPQPLDYGSGTTLRRPRRWPWRVCMATVVVGLALLITPSITVRQVDMRVDAVTGSMRFKTVWLGVVITNDVRVSPLERRLTSSGIAWSPSWQTLSIVNFNAFGDATARACSSAPPIYQLSSFTGDFAAASTDEELVAFVDTMQSGTDAEQEAAVGAARDRIVQSWSVQR